MKNELFSPVCLLNFELCTLNLSGKRPNRIHHAGRTHGRNATMRAEGGNAICAAAPMVA